MHERSAPPPLPAANAKLAEANAKLKEVQDKVAMLNAQLAALEAQYAAAVAEKDAAVAQAEACQRKLDLANRLIAALASGGAGGCAGQGQQRAAGAVGRCLPAMLPANCLCRTPWRRGRALGLHRGEAAGRV